MAQAVASLRGVPGFSPSVLLRQPGKGARDDATSALIPGAVVNGKPRQLLQASGVGSATLVDLGLSNGRNCVVSATSYRAFENAGDFERAMEGPRSSIGFSDSWQRVVGEGAGANTRALSGTDAAVPSGGSGGLGALGQSNADLVGKARGLIAASTAEVEQTTRSLAARSAAELDGGGKVRSSAGGNEATGNGGFYGPSIARPRSGQDSAEAASSRLNALRESISAAGTSGEADFSRLARMLTEFERDPSAHRLAALSDLVAGLAESREANESGDAATVVTAAAAGSGKTGAESAKVAETGSPSSASSLKAAALPRRLAPAPSSLPARQSPKPADVNVPVWIEQINKAAKGGEKSTDVDVVERSEYVAMRQRLNVKLSEANAYNRYLRREVNQREEALKKNKADLSAVHAELKDLAAISRELALAPGKASTAKIQGKFVLSHMASKIEELEQELKKQVAEVAAKQLRDVPVEWSGMAQDVKVMGSFDGWTYGEQMSPETTGAYTHFSATLKLRPGKYEIKFLVDGEWRLAPHWPQVGSGLTANNLLVVEVEKE